MGTDPQRRRLVEILGRTPLQPEPESKGVRFIGYDPSTRMVAVVFPDRDTVYGYPNLSDDEIRRFIEVRERHESLGHFVSTVIKKNHDHERVEWER
jgi:KTSC domain